NPAIGNRMLVTAQSKLPDMTRVDAQRGTGENCEVTAMKAAIGIRLAPAQNKSPAGICVTAATGLDPRRSAAPIARHVAASIASSLFNVECMLLFVMMVLFRCLGSQSLAELSEVCQASDVRSITCEVIVTSEVDLLGFGAWQTNNKQ